MQWKVQVSRSSDGKQIGSRTIKKQDTFMSSLWEKSHRQFSVMHKMVKLGSCQICKNKETYH